MTSTPPSTPDLPAAVLWDMDGTLVDTEPYWFATEYELVAEHGGSWDDGKAHSLVGWALADSAEFIAREGGVDLPPERIVAELVDRMIPKLRAALPWRPGARELLGAVRAAGVPCALVTMSHRPLAAALVDALPAGTFAATVTGSDVEHGKPHPEPYLTAAALLGVEPDRCVAVEDSPSGVASAVAAGVPTLVVANVLTPPPGPGREVAETLEGLTPADLGALRRRVLAAR